MILNNITDTGMPRECCAPLLLGVAAVGATGTAAATAATAGLFGIGGSFALGTALTTVATIGSVVAGVAGISQGARAKEEAAEFNEAQAQRDAKLTRQQTETTKQQSEVDLAQADRDRRLRLGANIASGGARGVGQPLDILRDNAGQEELDILTLESQGLLQAREGEIRARGFETEADLEAGRAATARTQGRLGVGAELLSGSARLTRQRTVLG